jgi:hypothetical protein
MFQGSFSNCSPAMYDTLTGGVLRYFASHSQVTQITLEVLAQWCTSREETYCVPRYPRKDP